MRRLLSLDYVLERPEFGWLATEPEKLAYFQRLGVSLAVLPYRLHRGPSADRPTRRYFPLMLPIAGSGTTTTFVYADPGGRRVLQSDRIGSWVAAHAALWDARRVRGGAVHVVAVTRTGDAAAANAAVLETWRGPPASPVPRSETDQQLIDEVELVKTTDNVRPPFLRTCLLSRPLGGLALLVGPVVIRSHTSESHSPWWGGELGWERPPSDLRIYSPGNRTYVRTCFRGQGSLPARADGATDPCGKAVSGCWHHQLRAS